MKLTKLTLENFRSFKEQQTIEFAPVTLLFGPNSVGKSTVLTALFYLHHVLAKGDCNPQRIKALGDKYVGGFKGLVNGRDLSKTIRIGIEYSKGNTIGASYTELRDLLEEEEADELQWLFNMPDAAGTVEQVALDLSIKWSRQLGLAYVSECHIQLDNQSFSTLKSTSGGQQAFIDSINYLHPLLLDDNNENWTEETEIVGFTSLYQVTLNAHRLIAPELNNELSTKIVNVDKYSFVHSPIAFKNINGALPVLGSTLETTLDFDDKKTGALIVEILSDAIVPIFDNLKALLDNSLCIGPLRAIPDPSYQPNPSPQTKDWYNGLAAWDYLEQAEIPFLQKVDHWMDQELDLGYRLTLKLEKSFSEYKKLNSSDRVEMMEKQLDAMIVANLSDKNRKVRFDDNHQQFRYALWDSHNQIEVTGCDIGVGVSQILPFIVAALSTKSGLIAIEQPELHVHPRVQVAIGDLLTQPNPDIGFLVETHSEHLMLRLLKRIRQTTDNELPEGIKPVSHDDVAIIYLENSDAGVKTRRIHIDEDGEFEERWPQGFFAERHEELM